MIEDYFLPDSFTTIKNLGIDQSEAFKLVDMEILRRHS